MEESEKSFGYQFLHCNIRAVVVLVFVLFVLSILFEFEFELVLSYVEL